MATSYIGPRPVLAGQNSKNMVNPYFSMTGKAKATGTYSFYPLYASSQLLTGAPDNNHVPGTGRHPGNVLLSQLLNGTALYVHPLSGTFADGTATYEGARFKPQQFKGLASAQALNGGHAVDRANDYALYSNYKFDGVASAEIFANLGHAAGRTSGMAASFGLFRPTESHGVPSSAVFTSGYGQPNTVSEYGRYKVQEYKGVPSAKAL